MKTKILVPQRRIQRRVRELARAIDRHYRGKEITVIAVLSGGVIFAADLVRRLKTPLRMDFIRASSYGDGRRSSGRVALRSYPRCSLRGAHVLLVDDILDSGLTLRKLTAFLRRRKPASVEACVLLRKRVLRPAGLHPRFVGLEIPNRYVYGYGLDLAGWERNRRDVVCLVETNKPAG